MSKETFSYTTVMPAGVEKVFAWHERPGAFERLRPPWARVEVLDKSGAGITDGVLIKMQVSVGPINSTWTVQHEGYVKNEQFCDTQVSGPLAFFRQLHKFAPQGPERSTLNDEVTYEMSVGLAGEIASHMVMQDELARLFRYRHRVVRQDLELEKKYDKPRLKIAVAGSTGFIGSALVPFLTTQGHTVKRLVRPRTKWVHYENDEIADWNPDSGECADGLLNDCDAVINLCGVSISRKRWDRREKMALARSRCASTDLVGKQIDQMVKAGSKPPRVWINASAIGYYGDRGAEVMTEQSAPGKLFLSELCREWESGLKSVEAHGVRVITLRIGVVLSPAGGALHKMLIPFKMGAGGPIGSGEQYFSWISMDDVLGTILHCLSTESLSGPVNCVAPNPVTNAQYASTLGKVLDRPAIVPMPAFAARMAFGEFADECLLASTRVAPTQLADSGYQFFYPKLDSAIRHALGKVLPTEGQKP